MLGIVCFSTTTFLRMTINGLSYQEFAESAVSKSKNSFAKRKLKGESSESGCT